MHVKLPSIWSLGRWQRFLPNLVTILMAILIAYTAAQLLWQLLVPTYGISPTLRQEVAVAAVSATPAPATGSSALQQAQQIVAKQLFGEIGQQPVADVVIDAPETRLNLKLKGILAIGSENGLAIIVADNSKEKVFAVGDTISGSVKLKTVYADRVLLEGNRGLETLRLTKQSDAIGFTAANRDTANAIPEDLANEMSEDAANEMPDDLANEIPEESNNTDDLAQPQTLSDYQALMRSNPAALANVAQVSMFRSNDGKQGYQIQSINDEKLFANLGLQQGDVIMQVNDIALDDPKNGLRAMQALRSAQRVKFTILRDGQSIELQADLGL